MGMKLSAFNNSHKVFSLFSGGRSFFPVVVWKESALAHILENAVLAVTSLYDLETEVRDFNRGRI